jgi:hypothetical protein
MRTNKRFSNTTFTKRVDHFDNQHNPDEPAICKECHAIYENHHWSFADKTKKKHAHKEWQPKQYTLCSACQKKREGLPCGFVYLDGAFYIAHQTEIENLLHNEAKKALAKNPLAKIMDWERTGNEKLTITTTTEHLAQRLGHALGKAFRGNVEYDFSHENKLTRVRWHRD